MKRPRAISSVHESIRNRTISDRNITGFERLEVSHHQKKIVSDFCSRVFTDMVNAGSTFQEALIAIYMSGVDHALTKVNQDK